MQISSLEWFACYEITICYLSALSKQTYVIKVVTTRPPRAQPLSLIESAALSFETKEYHLFDS